ncbi:unnamed protein product [Parajaminaea phylloscopi]
MGAYLPDGRDLARALAVGYTTARRSSGVSSSEESSAQSTALTRLPLELFLHIASYLVEPIPQALPFASSPAASSVYSNVTSMMSPEYQPDEEGYIALLRLSSLSLSLRQVLAPLVWQEILIQRNDRLGKLRTIADYYQRLASSFSEIGRLPYPLPLIRILRIQLPDQYLSFDQEVLRHLLRSGINPRNSLHTLVWDSELLPGPAIWRMLGEGEKMPGLEAELQHRKQKTLNQDQIRDLANSGHGIGAFQQADASDTNNVPDPASVVDSTLQGHEGTRHQPQSTEKAIDLDSLSLNRYFERRRPTRRATLEASADDLFTVADSSPRSASSRSRSASPAPPKGLQSLSLHCKVFYGGHIDMGRLRSLRHLHLTSFESHLLPPHLPSLLISLHRPLRSISLSSSKTSLLHDWDLIQRGVFSGLEFLDIYPVTPEWPLAEGLRSTGRNLRGLRLILDINGGFGNFDRLWRELAQSASTSSSQSNSKSQPSGIYPQSNAKMAQCGSPVGAFPELEFLIVDPFPQENTAPSFAAFLASCPRLRWLNGRRLRSEDGAPPGLELWDFNPDKLSSALPY